MKKGLTATQLKIIAIIAMTIDHIAWGFVEMFSVPGQIMHVIGRLTIPIMTFFVAEGYRKTSDLKKYITRMINFSVITIIPFYLFFGEEYGYRQNFIFDLLLVLLTLTVLESKKLPKPYRAILTAGIIVISLVIGGWPVFPILCTLIFYYIKDFRKQTIVFSATIVVLLIFMPVTIILNNRYSWGIYDSSWVWYQWFYFIGFILALPLIRLYNGQKGTYPLGKYFFFCYYPCHFLVLYSIKLLTAGEYRMLYMGLHIIALALTFIFLIRLFSVKPSKAATVSCMLAISGMIYIFGFILEVFAYDLSMAFAATIVQYFGECLVLLSFLVFMSEFCQIKIPQFVYSICVIIGIVIVYLVATAPINHIFYSNIALDVTGPFPRIDLSYGPGFYLFDIYSGVICGTVIISCIVLIKKTADKLAAKRAKYILSAIVCPWVAFLIKLTGITGGYEISSIGTMAAVLFIYTAVVRYDFFDSIQLAAENAIHKFGEGIMVLNPEYKIKYMNDTMSEMFPDAKVDHSINEYAVFRNLLEHSKDIIDLYDRRYQFDVTELIQSDVSQGYMITAKDMTEHFIRLEQMEKFARTDSLTGLYNRAYFMELYSQHRSQGGKGSLIMVDVDSFKKVNDTYGHDIGDKCLLAVTHILSSIVPFDSANCRLGGDEFVTYIKNEINKEVVGKYCTLFNEVFQKELDKIGYKGITSLSIGAIVLTDECSIDPTEDFTAAYKKADKMLYEVKEHGRANYKIWQE